LTGGNPRLINQLCDIALAYGFAEQVAWVTAKLVSRAATDRSQSGILPLSQSSSAHAVTEQDEERECQQIEGSRTTGHAETQPKFPSHVPDAASLYAQALAYKQARQFTRAVTQFEQVARNPLYAFKASVQIGLCLRSSGRHDDAASAFRCALQTSNGSARDKVQVQYLLGRSLEALSRRSEALEVYRRIERSAGAFRDVPARIKELSGRRIVSRFPSSSANSGWVKSLRRSWNQLIGNSI
jgi:tetratricopeptide (TPR) repeat protein